MNTPSPLIFDRALLRRRLARKAPNRALFDEGAEQIVERLEGVKRDFPTALDLSPIPFLKNEFVASIDTLAFDEEFLPFAPESFDLVASNLALHWVNDVPGTLAQIRGILKPDGLFVASLIGGNALHELRACLMDAEISVTGGISPRLSPTIDLQSAGALMQRAAFTLPVVDRETVTLLYKDMFALMRDLRAMHQTNAHTGRLRTFSRRAIFFEAADLYQKRFADAQGRIPATFEIIHLHGWK